MGDGTTKGDSLDGPGPGSSPGTGSADGTTTMTTTAATTNASEPTAGADAPEPTTATTANGETGGPSSTGTEGGPPPESCCFPQMPCTNDVVSECACALAPAECCGEDWSLYCVGVAVGCADVACDGPPHSCCEPSPMPGCDQLGIVACVCGEHPECCMNEWTEDCVIFGMKCPTNVCPG